MQWANIFPYAGGDETDTAVSLPVDSRHYPPA